MVRSGARRVVVAVCFGVWLAAGAAAGQGAAARPERVPPEELQAAIGALGSLDYPARTAAARTVRRTPLEQAVPALVQAVGEHGDGYVRFRALVLLSGFNDPRGRDVMLQALDSPNDRLREVAYAWVEHHPEGALTPRLLAALGREASEFVRPALVRALAALGSDPRVREALLVEVNRGEDFFRSTVIEALGDYRAQYAVAALIDIARQDGPLQDDAALALGKIGDRRALETLAGLQRSAPRAVQPAIAAAICLLGINCATHLRYIEDALRYAIDQPGYQALLRSATAGLAAVAASGSADALDVLFETGIPSRDPARAPIALAVGTAALRNPPLLLGVLEKRREPGPAVDLLREAFDMLEEHFEEERFFAAIRRTYWQAPEGSPTRAVCAALIGELEF